MFFRKNLTKETPFLKSAAKVQQIFEIYKDFCKKMQIFSIISHIFAKKCKKNEKKCKKICIYKLFYVILRAKLVRYV